MRYLLDTHTLLWFLLDDNRLSRRALDLIEDPGNDSFISIASLWEIAIKVAKGNLALGKPFSVLFPVELEANRIQLQGITLDSLLTVTTLPHYHRDPFDRLIIAHAICEGIPIIGNDGAFAPYPVSLEW